MGGEDPTQPHGGGPKFPKPPLPSLLPGTSPGAQGTDQANEGQETPVPTPAEKVLGTAPIATQRRVDENLWCPLMMEYPSN